MTFAVCDCDLPVLHCLWMCILWGLLTVLCSFCSSSLNLTVTLYFSGWPITCLIDIYFPGSQYTQHMCLAFNLIALFMKLSSDQHWRTNTFLFQTLPLTNCLALGRIIEFRGRCIKEGFEVIALSHTKFILRNSCLLKSFKNLKTTNTPSLK